MSGYLSRAPAEGGPPVRDAATVIVLRDGPDGPQTLMLQRHGRSGFAATAWVFPGGTVDAADRRLDPSCWAGIDPRGLAGRFGDPPDVVLGRHVAAVRETFEEAGLLLARRADDGPVDLDDPGLQPMRRRLVEGADAGEFAGWLAAQGLVLDLGLLTYWSRWVTPRAEARRYDTAFFLARAPQGQVAAHDRSETTGQHWLTPRDALARSRAGELFLVYPTVKNLEELQGFSTIDALVAHARARPEVRRVLPHLEEGADGSLRLIHPDEPDFPAHLYQGATR